MVKTSHSDHFKTKVTWQIRPSFYWTIFSGFTSQQRSPDKSDPFYWTIFSGFTSIQRSSDKSDPVLLNNI